MNKSFLKVVATVLAVASPIAVYAAYSGPTATPTGNNTAGPLWLQSSVSTYQTGDYAFNGDAYFTPSKSIRVDQSGASTVLNISNYNAGGTGFTANIRGDLNITGFGSITTGTLRVPTICLNGVCRNSWPSGSGGTLGGSGTANRMAKFSAGTTLTDSILMDTGASILLLNSDGSTGIQMRPGGSGLANTFIGNGSGNANPSGTVNTALGSNALNLLTTGSANTAIGEEALMTNTVGSNNTAVGVKTLQVNTAGQNTAVGTTAMWGNTTGYDNTAIGYESLRRNTTGYRNTALGSWSGSQSNLGNHNTMLGFNADATGTLSNATAIGANALVTASNSLVLGNAANVGIGVSNPGAKLTVVGATTNPSTYDDGKGMFVSSNTGGPSVSIAEFRHDNLSQGVGIGYASIFATGANASQSLDIFSRGTSPLSLNALGGGNVGVGTTSPAGKLTISGAGGSAAAAGMEFYTTGNASGYNAWAGRVYTDTPTGSWGTAPLVISVPNTAGTEVKTMTFLNGRVGVGVSPTSSRLTVQDTPGTVYLSRLNPSGYSIGVDAFGGDMGVNARATAGIATAVMAYGGNTGVLASGNTYGVMGQTLTAGTGIGVYGVGDTGMYGQGPRYGGQFRNTVNAGNTVLLGPVSAGVATTGTTRGLAAEATDMGGVGIWGKGDTAIQGLGQSIGVYGSGSIAMRAYGNLYGLDANATGMYGVNAYGASAGISSSGGTYSFLGNSGILYNSGSVGIGTTSPSYKLDVNGDIIAGWLRTRGATGWYNETYGGGWYMTDSSWLRTYNQKNIWTGVGVVGTDGGLTVGYGGGAPNAGGASIAGSVSIGTGAASYGRLVVMPPAGGLPAFTMLQSNDAAAGWSILTDLTNGNFQFWRLAGGGWSIKATIRESDGAWLAASDRDFKTDISKLSKYGIDDIMKLEPVTYRMKDDESKSAQVGFIAQDLQKIMPEFVSGKAVSEGGDGLGVNYGGMVTILTKGMQDQQKEIEALKDQNESLLKRLEALETKLK